MLTKRVKIARITIGVGLFIALLLTPNLWLSERWYALTPVWSGLPQISPLIERLIYIAILLLTALFVVGKGLRVTLVLLPLILFLYSLWDQQRWVPFFYQIEWCLVVLAIYGRTKLTEDNARYILLLIGIIISGTYFWSGVQKFNYNFVFFTVPWMFEGILGDALSDLLTPVLACSFFIPFVETFLGLGLWFRSTRSVALIVGLGMHAFILLSVGPFGSNFNSQVWSWNVASAILMILAFWKTDFYFSEFRKLQSSTLQTLLVVFLWVAPIGSYWGVWDDFLSMTLYSNNAKKAIFYLDQEAYSRLPEPLQGVSRRLDGNLRIQVKEQEDFWQGQFEYYLELRDFGYADLNTPDYHAKRIFRSVAKKLCSDLNNPTGLAVTIAGRADWLTGKREWKGYSCSLLK